MTTSAAPTITRLKLPALRHFVESQLWAVERRRGLALLEQLATRANGQDLTPDPAQADRSGARRGGRSSTKSGGAVAVLPLYGPIAQRMDMMMAMCGGTSAERFADEFDAAMKDPDVSAIVIDCDSPGGSVQGTPELAKRIFDARGKGKQLIAVSNGCMASAAYWICSACDEVVASPSSETGSIGVFTVHVDESGMNEMLGLKYTLIKAGDHKAEGNPWEPLSGDAEAFIQGQIDEMYSSFIGAVAKHRGVKASEVKEKFGQGRCFTAKQALAVGMIDRVATLEDVLKKLGANDVGMSGRPARAFGQAQATTLGGEDGVVAPHLLNTGTTMRADAAPGEPDDDGDTVCPECAAPMEGPNCTKCEYVVPSADDSDDDQEASARADRAAATADISPDTDKRPDKAKEQPVSTPATAAPGGADPVLKAERQRVAKIRQLCQKWRVSDEQYEAMVEEGISPESAALRIADGVETRAAAAPSIRVGADREAERPFANAGEQLQAVIRAGKTGRVDRRLEHVNAQAMKFAGSPSGMNESVGSEGGFYLQNDLLPGIIEPVYADDPVLSRVKRIPIGDGKNGIKFNVVDETSRADGSRFGGIQMFYADEADAGTPKKPKLRRVELELRKIIGLAYLTDELQQDAPAAQTLIVDAFQTELRFMIATGIWRGPGGNAPLGFLKGNAFVAQAIEAAQTIANTAASISQNVAKMLMHIPAGLLSDVIWLYNPELLPTLLNATVGNTSIPVFVPMAGLSDQSAVDRILGRPAFASEQAEAVGTPGDLVAICPSQYALADKGGPTVATSLHVRFVNDEEALRITYRYDGQPIWAQSVTPYKGSAARTPYVGLATRS